MVVADPPYLAEECLTKTARTVQLMKREGGHAMLLTGATMQACARATMGVRPAVFRPAHSCKLGNEFYVYASFDPTVSILGGENTWG